MAARTTNEKDPRVTSTGSLENHTTNDLDFSIGERHRKAFKTLAARFALIGHTLTRSDPADGAVMYYAGRWGLQKALPDLDAVQQFLAHVGGGV
jgi:hypothetical protein